MIFAVIGARCRGLLVALLALSLVPSSAAVGAGPAAGGMTASPDAGATAAAAGGAAASDAATAKRLAALRKKVLKDEDFIENDELNRDPFHSYVRLFVDRGAATKTRKVAGVFDKVGLEELTLIAIITGDDTPRAMFRDASGYGQSVKKGDFLSRAGARVTKVLSDRVIVELSEQTGTGEARVVEKAILVNPDEAP